eukprot:11138041-Alexandrium_andersonii.AAC.1
MHKRFGACGAFAAWTLVAELFVAWCSHVAHSKQDAVAIARLACGIQACARRGVEASVVYSRA